MNGDIKEIVANYFDLNRNYSEIKEKLSKIDENVKLSIKYGEGIRILNQDLWETIISFIISANNNIPRIKGIIERLSQKYGKEIDWNGEKYYTFPTPEELKKAEVQDFRELGTGFRDIRLYETTRTVLENKVVLKDLYNVDTLKAREELLTLSGVGPKVADCILLFSDLKRFDVFPIDVWVRRVMNELYIKILMKLRLIRRILLELLRQNLAIWRDWLSSICFIGRGMRKKNCQMIGSSF